MVPVLGAVPDLLDLVWTALEVPFGISSGTDLGLAAAGLVGTVVPVIGDGAAGAAKVGARLTARAIPQVADAKLGNIVRDLYKGAKMPNPIGTGSTADAIRSELATGLATQSTELKRAHPLYARLG